MPTIGPFTTTPIAPKGGRPAGDAPFRSEAGDGVEVPLGGFRFGLDPFRLPDGDGDIPQGGVCRSHRMLRKPLRKDALGEE